MCQWVILRQIHCLKQTARLGISRLNSCRGKVDYLDLYLIHSPNTGLRWSGVKGEQMDPPLFF